MNHYFDESGVYCGSCPIGQEHVPPVNAIRVTPPHEDGLWPILNPDGNGWELVEDHRGEEGWVDGIWTKVTTVGPLPAGWSVCPPPNGNPSPEETGAALQVQAEQYRDQAIQYYIEAAACRLEDDLEGATASDAKMDAALRQYSKCKRTIEESLSGNKLKSEPAVGSSVNKNPTVRVTTQHNSDTVAGQNFNRGFHDISVGNEVNQVMLEGADIE